MNALWRRGDGVLVIWLTLAALALLLFWPLVLGRQHLVPFHVMAGDPALTGLDVGADRPDWSTYDLAPVTVQYAEKSLVAQGLRRGEFPLWNPYNGLGFPLLADGQCQPLAPFFMPFLAWPTPWVYSLVLVAQLLFGGAGMERLLKALGSGTLARLAGAVLFAFNPYTLKYLAYCNAWAYVWYPWVFWAAWRMAREPRRWVGFAAAVALMGMSGHPEEAFMGAAAGFLFYGVVAWSAGGPRALVRPRSLAAPAAAVALSAWWVLPFLEWVKGSWSPRMGLHSPIPYDPSACFLLASELLWLPAMLALALAGCRRRTVALGLAPALLWALVLLFPWPHAVQRLFDLGFMSGRYTRSLAWMALAVLAALGLEAWVKGEVRGWLRWVGAALFLAWSGGALWIMAAGGLRAVNGARVPLGGIPAGTSAAVWLLVAAGLALWLLPVERLSRYRLHLATAMTAVVLGGALLSPPSTWAPWNASVPRVAPALASPPAGGGRVWLPHEGLRQDLPPSLSAAFSVRDIRYVSPLTPRRLAPLAGDLRLGFSGFLDWRPEVMAFAGVAVKGEQRGGALAAVPNPDPVARGFWVDSTERVTSPQLALEAALRDGAWRRTIYLESHDRTTSPVAAGGHAGGGRTATCEAVQDLCNRSTWRVACPAGGWFVLRDLFSPGWHATVDGAPVHVMAADGVFRAVPVPAGDHLVAFTYRPASLLAGTAVTCGTLMLLVGACLWSKRNPESRKEGGRGRDE